jgi:polysaccharide biosynthesis transport protein
VVDCQVVAGHVDKIVFVIEWERTPREVVQRAMNVLGDQRLKVAGMVMNKADVKQMRYHSTYYSYYNKAYKSYYTS